MACAAVRNRQGRRRAAARAAGGARSSWEGLACGEGRGMRVKLREEQGYQLAVGLGWEARACVWRVRALWAHVRGWRSWARVTRCCPLVGVGHLVTCDWPFSHISHTLLIISGLYFDRLDSRPTHHVHADCNPHIYGTCGAAQHTDSRLCSAPQFPLTPQ